MPFFPQQNKQCSDLAKPTKPQHRSAANSPSSETSLSQQSQGHELRAHRRSLERTMSLQDESGELRKPGRSPEPGLSPGSQGKSSVRTWNTLIMEERVKERTERQNYLSSASAKEESRPDLSLTCSYPTTSSPFPKHLTPRAGASCPGISYHPQISPSPSRPTFPRPSPGSHCLSKQCLVPSALL